MCLYELQTALRARDLLREVQRCLFWTRTAVMIETPSGPCLTLVKIMTYIGVKRAAKLKDASLPSVAGGAASYVSPSTRTLSAPAGQGEHVVL